MLTIEQLNSLNDLREKFLAVTGLTWDPTTINDEDFLKTIQWYFPKGAGFDEEHIAFDRGVIEEIGGDTSDPYYNEGEGGGDEPTPGPTPEPGDDDNTQQNIDNTINDPSNNVTVNQDNGEGGTSSEPLDPNSTVEPVTLGDNDDDPTNDPALGTSDGEIIVTND